MVAYLPNYASCVSISCVGLVRYSHEYNISRTPVDDWYMQVAPRLLFSLFFSPLFVEDRGIQINTSRTPVDDSSILEKPLFSFSKI